MSFLNQKFEDLDRIFTNPTDIVGKFDNIQITIIALFFIVIASASTNLVANFIPSQYSLINFYPNKLNIKKCKLYNFSCWFFDWYFLVNFIKSNWDFIIC